MKSRLFRLLAVLSLSAAAPVLGGQGLAIGPADVRIEARDDGGYDLYVRKKPQVASVLLTESTKDPLMKADNFAYRAAEYNAVNGNEKRMLNGQALPPSSKLYSLISSTPLPDASFGQAFRILIPPVLLYGYPWSRSGTVAVGRGTFINIRSFAKPYADYAGSFLDNPYQIAVSTKPPAPKEPEPRSISYQELPKKEIAPAPPADDRTSAKIGEAIDADPGKTLDLVVCLDTTESMDPYIEDIKKNLGPIIRERVARFKSFRVGLVLYKDYWPDDYITRKYPFTSDIAAFERNLRGIMVVGGKDIPEAEVEALHAAATEFDWSADRRQVILVSDAPPHTSPRGKIGFDDAAKEAEDRGIELDAITEPAKFPSPNPSRPEFENELKALRLLAVSGTKARVLALAEGGNWTRELLDSTLIAPLSADGGGEVLGPARVLPEPAAPPRADAAALGVAAAAGASHAVLARTRSSGAFSETVSRLIEVATGKELARDVSWRARSGGAEAVFVNGQRSK